MPLWKKKTVQFDSSLKGVIKVRGDRQLSARKKDYGINPPVNPRGRKWEPRSLIRGMHSGSNYPGSFIYTGQNRADFYRYMRNSIPIISGAIAKWVRLCATELSLSINGSANEIHRAEKLFEQLDSRLLELPFGKGSGMRRLIEGYYQELFTTGRFAGEAILSEDGRSVDHFSYIDPQRISYKHGEKGWTSYFNGDDDKPVMIDPQRFFNSTLTTDLNNPAGIEPLGCIPFVAEIEQLMLEDMARSSHNAGTPRFQIRISQPEQHPHESKGDYISRANKYFSDTVAEFHNLEPDQNIFTWNDVDVQMIGGGGHNWNWRLNREQVIEDVITGLNLYPWVLGRTHRSTQNWVQSQFDLLMQMVAVYQQQGIELANWIYNMELQLQGVKAIVSHKFAGHHDPFLLERMQTEKLKLEIVDRKVERGYISKDEGAGELGYTRAYRLDDEDETG